MEITQLSIRQPAKHSWACLLLWIVTSACKDGHNKGQKGVDLTEAEDIKKRWQEYTENYTKKIFMTQITMMV